MKHIRTSLYSCSNSHCFKEWDRHTEDERRSSGLCMWWNLDTQTVCMLLLPCNMHPGKGHAGLAHWRDPNAPVRLGFIEYDFEHKEFTMESYSMEAMLIAASRGWDWEQHQVDLDSGDEDVFGLSHPILWLTEDEAERYFA